MFKKALNRGKSKKKPEWMITYWCPRCELDSGGTEVDGPYCFFCERSDGLTELAREPMSPQAIAKRMKIAADRMMENLRKAHGIAESEWPQDEKEEILLLESMAQGQDFQAAIHEMAGKMEKDMQK